MTHAPPHFILIEPFHNNAPIPSTSASTLSKPITELRITMYLRGDVLRDVRAWHMDGASAEEERNASGNDAKNVLANAPDVLLGGIPDDKLSGGNATPFISMMTTPKCTLYTITHTLHRYIPSLHSVRFHSSNHKWIVLTRRLEEILPMGKTGANAYAGLALDLNGVTYLIDYDNTHLRNASSSFSHEEYNTALRYYTEVLKRYPGRHDGGVLRARVLCNLCVVALKLLNAKKCLEFGMECLKEVAHLEQHMMQFQSPQGAMDPVMALQREKNSLFQRRSIYSMRKAYLYLGIYNLLRVWDDDDFDLLKEEYPFLRVFEVIHGGNKGLRGTTTNWFTDMVAVRDGLEAHNDIVLSSMDLDLDYISNQHLQVAFKCWRQFVRLSTTDGNNTQHENFEEWQSAVVLLFATCQLRLPMCTACGCSLTSQEDTSRMVHGALRAPKEITLKSTMSSLERDLQRIYDNIRQYVLHEEERSSDSVGSQVEVAFPVCSSVECEKKIREVYVQPLRVDVPDSEQQL